MYLVWKSVHVGAVVVSTGLFLARGARMLAGAGPDRGALRVLPHVVDTVLLASAAMLALALHQYPFTAPWLTGKLTGLVLYIVFGSLALRRGRTRTVRVVSLVLAVLAVGYVIATAVHHDPWPWHW